MSHRRRVTIGPDRFNVPDRGPDGRPICRWCRTVIVPPRRTFCSDTCVHEWKVRSDPSYVRVQVWKRDRGRCRLCLANIKAAEREWRREKPPTHCRKARRQWKQLRPRWEADHIVAVADGGGECGLDNYRLLCRACHVQVTALWRRARAGRIVTAA